MSALNGNEGEARLQGPGSISGGFGVTASELNFDWARPHYLDRSGNGARGPIEAVWKTSCKQSNVLPAVNVGPVWRNCLRIEGRPGIDGKTAACTSVTVTPLMAVHVVTTFFVGRIRASFDCGHAGVIAIGSGTLYGVSWISRTKRISALVQSCQAHFLFFCPSKIRRARKRGRH